jgi:hypothetical protein
MISEQELDNILVEQKDMMLQLLNDIEKCENPIKRAIMQAELMAMLKVCANLWVESNYYYKAMEIIGRYERCISQHSQST